MKTPIQDKIDKYTLKGQVAAKACHIAVSDEVKSELESDMRRYSDIIDALTKILPSEQKAIEDAYKASRKNDNRFISASDYFTQTYKP